MNCPRRDAARFPRTQNSGAGRRETTMRQQSITPPQYSMPLPLVASMLTDAWPEEVLLSLRLHRALTLLVAALSEWEVRP
jgi:hypothetical protein